MFKRILDAILSRNQERVHIITRVEVRERDRTKISVQEWRSNPNLCDQARKVLNQPEFQLMLDCLRNDHPGMSYLPVTATPDQRSNRQAMGEGYSLALNSLEALGVGQKPVEHIPTTYQVEVPPGVDPDE